VFEQSTPKAVGSAPSGANSWGAVDLIGNVWEWTGSEVAAYPNSKAVIEKKGDRKEYIIRGGGYASKSSGNSAITSTTRLWVEAERQDGFLGFRLARSD
jgi:iron(II)-dependent oxidoreductase